MPMTDEDWKRLKLLQNRLQINAPGRNNLLFEIVGQKSKNDPFAQILQISGDSDFFDALNNLWKVFDDNLLIEKYIRALQHHTVNGSDQQWIRELIERLGRVPPSPKETDILLDAVGSILERNEVLGKNLLEATQHVRSAKIPRGMQNQREWVSQFLTHDFPLICLRGTLDACVNRQIRFEDPSTRKDLIVLKDMFTVASFPGEDKKKLLEAMQSVWMKAEIKQGAELKTSSKSFAEDMLISTWLQVTDQQLEDWEVLQLLHRDPNYPINAKERKSVMFRRVHVLSQPAVQPTGDALIRKYAESCICEATGILQNPENPITVFNNFLEVLAEDHAIAALFITKEFTETIGVLKKYFPRLVLVILSTTDAERYSSIYREISFIDNNIARICRS
jgi:hypothetical protein